MLLNLHIKTLTRFATTPTIQVTLRTFRLDSTHTSRKTTNKEYNLKGNVVDINYYDSGKLNFLDQSGDIDLRRLNSRPWLV